MPAITERSRRLRRLQLRHPMAFLVTFVTTSLPRGRLRPSILGERRALDMSSTYSKQTVKVRVKYSPPYNSPRRPRGGVEVYLYTFFNLDARWGWVNAMPRPIYPQEWPGTCCTGGWVVWMGAENLAPAEIRSPNRPARYGYYGPLPCIIPAGDERKRVCGNGEGKVQSRRPEYCCTLLLFSTREHSVVTAYLLSKCGDQPSYWEISPQSSSCGEV